MIKRLVIAALSSVAVIALMSMLAQDRWLVLGISILGATTFILIGED